jgi:hypothetical protein
MRAQILFDKMSLHKARAAAPLLVRRGSAVVPVLGMGRTAPIAPRILRAAHWCVHAARRTRICRVAARVASTLLVTFGQRVKSAAASLKK